MPTLHDLMDDVQAGKITDFGEHAMVYVQELSNLTGREVIVYETSGAPLVPDDMGSFMSLIHSMKSGKKKKRELDLIISSPGGSPATADTLVAYLRQKFDHIRVIVPSEAMSAATMVACGGDSIMMARHSFLGPIDLQMSFGEGFHAAQDIIDQYELVKADFDDPADFWDGPGKNLYHPTLIVKCKNALAYGKEVAERHLNAYMFKGQADAAKKAHDIASTLADHQLHKDHGRRLSRPYLQQLGLKIEELEDNQDIQDLVLSIHHCHTLWFQMPWILKSFMNSAGKSLPGVDVALFRKLQQSIPKSPTTVTP